MDYRLSMNANRLIALVDYYTLLTNTKLNNVGIIRPYHNRSNNEDWNPDDDTKTPPERP